MTYHVCYESWDGVFAVPSDLVDRHLKLAGAVQLKVALWVLRQGRCAFSPEAAAKALHLPTGEVLDAVQYWVAAGLFCEAGGKPAQTAAGELEAGTAEPAVSAAEPPAPVVHRQPKPSGMVLAERVLESEEVSFLMQEAQMILGKTISPAMSSTLLAAHDDYGLPIEVIVMLLRYVMSIGKSSTNYVDAVARGWAEDGIFTHDAAEKKIHQLTEIGKAWRKLETALGIAHRSPSTREEHYTDLWLFQWKFSVEMVREAYERCVDATGKLSLGYMHKILERWQKNGITTPEQAKAETEARSAKRAEQSAGDRTYDLEAFAQLDFTKEFPNLNE